MKRTLILILFLFSQLCYCPIVNKAIKAQQLYEAGRYDFIYNVYSLPFTPENLWQAIIYADIKQPEIVLKQARIETGEFTSEIFRYGRNICGMKLPKYRCTCAVGEYKGHAMYNHFWDSVMDYKYWQDYMIEHGWKINDYLAFLWALPYAIDKHYIDKLKDIV